MDQILEDTLNKGITNIGRIGFGSKNDKIDEYSLTNIIKNKNIKFDR